MAVVATTARRLGESDIDVATAIGAFVAARGPFLGELESIGRRRALEAPAVMGLYAEAAALLDRLLLHFVATFQAPTPTQPLQPEDPNAPRSSCLPPPPRSRS